MARDQASDVLVIHIRERVLLGRGGYLDLETTDEANRVLVDARRALEARGVSAETCTDTSPMQFTARQIVEAGVAWGAQLIVIGDARGKSTLWASLRGSVSHDILHRSKVPVLVVP
jgi:nucleotide-binding universal stress UspA family protein